MSGYLALKPMENNGNAMHGGGNIAPGGEDEDPNIQEMLTTVKTGDEEKLKNVLKELPAKSVNHVYQYPHYASALSIATKNNSANLVAILLKAGADSNSRDQTGKGYYPIHHAANNGNSEILQALCKGNADINAKDKEFERSALHILAAQWKPDKENAFREALKVLLDCKDINIDSTDINGSSPIFMAATKGWEYMVKALVLKGANIYRTVGNKTVADVIKKKLPALDIDNVDVSRIEKPRRDFADELYGALKREDSVLFKQILKEINTDEISKDSIIEKNHGEYTLLGYACYNGLSEFVEELLKNGADPAQRDDNDHTSPILYATRNGYHVIVEMLLSNMKERGDLKKGALRQTGPLKETPLHKVVKRERNKKKDGVDYYRCLQLLMEKKEYLDIDALDEFDNTPLHYAVLCDDQSFVRTLLLNGSHLGIRNKFGTLAITRIQASVLEEVLNDSIKYRNNIADRDFEIILHYSLLAPATASQQPETECLRFLSGSRKHRHLLLHPIIDTFLFLKWQRIRQYYFFNIFAYTAFLALITAYVLIYHGTYVPPKDITESIDSVSPINETNEKNVEENAMGDMIGKFILQALIALFTLYIALREGVQFCVSWKLYICRFENWLELSIIALTVALLFIPMNNASQQSLCAWLILFSWTEFILLLGRHPYLSVYITMFTTVTYNFLKFIIMFSFMIFAFSISFYLVFQLNENYKTYDLALLKTLAMTTGELEYTDLPLSDFPFSSQLLFVVFVFLIVLVLMNLLNGLAVSDIQQIQQEAEIVSYSSRVELISYIESVFLASPFQRVLPGPITCCENGAEDCFLVACMESSNPAMKLLKWMGRRTLMFHSCLRDRKITVYPNRGIDRWQVCDCHSFKIKEYQIEAAKDVVLEKESSANDSRISSLEARIDDVMAAISELTDKVDKHVLCPSPH